MKKLYRIGSILLLSLSLLIGCSSGSAETPSKADNAAQSTAAAQTQDFPDSERAPGVGLSGTSSESSDIPAYNDQPYVVTNNNVPNFTEDEISVSSFESYSELDPFGRCGVAMASIGQDLMPTEKRESIGMIKPSGWQTAKYDDVDGKYLYNRCHLIGFQLTGENANVKNLITGTRYLNVEGMLPFENMVADYVKETNNHVMYRVTPIYSGDNLLADGVLMEGYSVEDKGDGISFCIFAYNVQPGIEIDYATGDSVAVSSDSENEASDSLTAYILNTGTKKFHYPSCSSVSQMNDSNKEEFKGHREELIKTGYSPCGRCHP